MSATSPRSVLRYKSPSPEPSQLWSRNRSDMVIENMEDCLDLTVNDVLGRGSYGQVVSATDNFGHECAVKSFMYKIGHVDLEDHTAFREAYYSFLFKHPNIVKARDFKICESNIFLVTDLATSDLGVYLKTHTLSGDQKLKYIFELADAVSYMHKGDFVHCDLKPANILIFGDQLRIGDLGFVRARENRESRVQKRVICQTIIYRSPEQFDEEIPIKGYHDNFPEKQRSLWRNNDLRAEYWSLGILCLDIIYNYPFVTNHKVVPYDRFLSLLVSDYEDGIPISKTIQNIFGAVHDIDKQLLELVGKYLLVLDQDERSLDLFMNDELFATQGYFISKTPFIFPQTDLMYQSGGITINNLTILFKWFLELNNDIHYPMIILSNAMDYIIQHAHLITEASEIQLFGIAVLWLMDQIYWVRNNRPNMEEYLYYSGNIYTPIQFMDMIDRIDQIGFLSYESLYFQLPNMRLAVKGVLMMIYDLETYINYGTPHDLAIELIEDANKDDIPKVNGYVNLPQVRQQVL